MPLQDNLEAGRVSVACLPISSKDARLLEAIDPGQRKVNQVLDFTSADFKPVYANNAEALER